MHLAALLALVLVSPQRTPSGDPDAARLVTADIPRFYEAFDVGLEGGPEELRLALEDLYLGPGSAGVRDFTPGRIQNAAHLAQTVWSNREAYAAARPRALAVAEAEPRLRELFHRAKEILPDFVFPDVYFVIGALNSGGTSTAAGLIIGMEMEVNRLETLPALVMHELVHFQQGGMAPVTDLLGQCLREGSADFLGELISGGNINAKTYAWAAPREAELWDAFLAVAFGTDPGRWLYVYDETRLEGWPPDLGYWAGYRIAQAYFETVPDRRQAIHDLLHVQDYRAFLEASGLPSRPAEKAAPR